MFSFMLITLGWILVLFGYSTARVQIRITICNNSPFLPQIKKNKDSDSRGCPWSETPPEQTKK